MAPHFAQDSVSSIITSPSSRKGLVSSKKKYRSVSTFKRDPEAAEGGFAVEFPLICAKLGAATIPEVLLVDNFNKVSKPTSPLFGYTPESTSTTLNAWMPRVSMNRTQEPIPPSDPYFTTYHSTGRCTYVSPPVNKCPPPSPVLLVQCASQRGHLLQSLKMRGIQADEAILDAMGICFELYPSFQKITLENCKLTAATLQVLLYHLRNSRTISEVKITENPIPEQNFHMLLEENTGVTALSLQNCDITDSGAKLIAAHLSYRDPYEHQGLVSLDLSSNKIGDSGIKSLAEAMRTNRTLKNLVLSKNNIGDVGAEALASITMKFALKSEELRCRQRRSVMRKEVYEKRVTQAQIPEHAASCELEPTRRITKAKRPSKRVTDQDSSKIRFDQHPYVWDARPDGPNLWCVGNVTLETLGLNNNHIGVKGVRKMLDAVRYQDNLKKVESRPNIGLSIVELEGNPIPPGLSELNRLQEVLTIKMRAHKKARHKSIIMERPPNLPGDSKTTSRAVIVGAPSGNSPYMGYFRKVESRAKMVAGDDLKGIKSGRGLKHVNTGKLRS